MSSGLLGYITETCPDVRGTHFRGSRHHHHLEGLAAGCNIVLPYPSNHFFLKEGSFRRFQLVISEREGERGRGMERVRVLACEDNE